MKRLACAGLVLALAFTAACQSPTEADSTISYDDIVDVTSNPVTVIADTNTEGRTYRIVRGNNQPDDILAYDWHAGFDVSINFNNNATDDDVDMAFPVKLVATALAVKRGVRRHHHDAHRIRHRALRVPDEQRVEQPGHRRQQSDRDALRGLVRPAEPAQGGRHPADVHVHGR